MQIIRDATDSHILILQLLSTLPLLFTCYSSYLVVSYVIKVHSYI